jgi:spore germination protein GerM
MMNNHNPDQDQQLNSDLTTPQDSVTEEAKTLEAESSLPPVPFLSKEELLDSANFDTEIEDLNPVEGGKVIPFWRSSGFITGIIIAIVVIGGGTLLAQWALNTLKSSEQPNHVNTTDVITAPSPSEDNPTIPNVKVQVFWLTIKDNQINLAPIDITIDQNDRPQDSLKSAFERLLAGSNNPDYASEIPTGTKLLDLKVVGDNVYLDLSKEFTTGGGSASMTGRLAQVIYTATSLNPNAQVWLNVEGKALDVLGGEGLMVDQPMTRQIFEENFTL